MNVSLTPDLEQFVSAKVESGRYNSASEVIREALRLLEEQDRIRASQLAGFNQELRRRLDSLDRGRHVDQAARQVQGTPEIRCVSKYILSVDADVDLDDIWEYIAQVLTGSHPALTSCAAVKEHFSRALRPLCGLRASPFGFAQGELCGGKEGTYFASLPSPARAGLARRLVVASISLSVYISREHRRVHRSFGSHAGRAHLRGCDSLIQPRG